MFKNQVLEFVIAVLIGGFLGPPLGKWLYAKYKNRKK